MAATFKLPKVAQYVKNVGKSVVFLTMDTIKEQAPGVTEFVETNEEIFKEVYASARNFRKTIRDAENSIRKSNVYQAVEFGIKNMLEDIKTGNFYNDRSGDIGGQALGIEDFEDDIEVSYESNGESHSESAGTDSFEAAIGAAATCQATAVAKSTDMIVSGNKASTKLLMSEMSRMSAGITAGVGSVYTAVSTTNAFLQGPMRAHIENSTRFYEENLKATNEINLMLKELLEMQRNLYNVERTKANESKLDQSFSDDGSLDLRGYAKNVKSNVRDMLDDMGLGMMFDNMGGGNPLMLFAAAPFKMIFGSIGERLLSADFKKALSSFDKGVTTLFSQFVARLNSARNKDDGSLMSILGKIFGLDVSEKTGINPSNYNKGAVQFDGKTRQSIIETIPGYLSRIEAALTNGGERHYDFDTGTWKDARTISRDYEEDRRRAISRGNSDLLNKTNEIARNAKLNKDQTDELRADAYALAEFLFNNNGDFDPKAIIDKFGRKKYDRMMKMYDRDTIRGLAIGNMKAKQDLSRLRKSQEESGGIQRQLFNGAYDIHGIGDGRRNNPTNAFTSGGILSSSFDSKGRNIFWYLTEIIDILRNNRKIKRGKHSRGRASSGAPRPGSDNGESGSEGGSDDEPPDPEGDYDDKVDAFFAMHEEEERKRNENKKKSSSGIGTWIKEKANGSKVGTMLAKIIGPVSSLLAKPMDYATKLLDKADNSMFKLIFGENELKDAEGNPVDNVFQALMLKIKGAFKELKNELKKIFSPIGDWLKEKFKPIFEKWIKPVTDKVKDIGKNIWSKGKESLHRTIATPISKGIQNVKDYRSFEEFASEAARSTGRNQREIQMRLHKRQMTKAEYKALDSARRRNANADSMAKYKAYNKGVFSADEITGTATRKDQDDPGVVPIVESAFGRYVTKRGLTMISPGEIIIPASFDKNEQRKMLALERKDRDRIERHIGLNAAGTVNAEDTDSIMKNLKRIYIDNQGKSSENIASGVIGAGAGLLLGNPLLGAMAGAGISILKNSNTFQNILFGQEMADGTSKPGLIPKKVQRFFKKALPDMGDFGLAGGLLGLITPFGPLGGAAIGAGIGMLKHSDGFKRFIFGDEETGVDGLISKESVEKAKEFLIKAAPKAAIGAIAGVFAGPFGLIGNAALGAGAGMIASTDTFHNMLFGNPEDKNSTGGLFGAINRGIFDPAKEKIGEILEGFKKYAKNYILDPLRDFWKPFKQMIKNTISNVGNGVKDFINDMFERSVGVPLNDFLQEKLFKPLTKVFFGILKAPIAVGKAIVAAPFKALQGVGNNMRMSQIRKGSATDMTASERLAFREQHGGLAKFRNFFGKDKMVEQDQMLAGMDVDQLKTISKGTRAGLQNMRELQKSRTAATDAVSSEWSKFFNEKVNGKTRYSRVNYKKINNLLKKIQEKGDLDLAQKEIMKIEGLSESEKVALFNSIKQKLGEVAEVTEVYGLAKEGTANIDKQIEAILGHRVSKRSDKRKLYSAVQRELMARADAAEDAKEEGKEVTPETGAVNAFHEEYKSKTDSLISLITSIKDYTESMVKFKDRTMTKEEYKEFSRKRRMEKNGIDQEKINEEVAAKKKAASSKAIAEVADLPESTESSKEKEKKTSFGDKAKTFFSNIFKKKKDPHEDSKEATDARKEEAEKDADEKSANDAERESVGWLKKLYGKFFGDEKKDKKGGSGILGRIGSMVGGVFQFLGGPLKSIAKVGLPVIGIAGGVSLLGYLSQWVKEKFWPKLKEIFFGTTGGDGTVQSTGLLGGVKDGIRNVVVGDPNNPDDGLWGKFKKTTVGSFLSNMFDDMKKSGGFWPYISEHVLPTVIDKMVIGWGYAMENIVAPLTTAIIKNLPMLIGSLAKALIKGITAAIFKKEISRDDASVEVDPGSIGTTHNAINGSLSGSVSNEVKSAFSVKPDTTPTKYQFDIGKMMDSNYASADETYDANGNHLNKSSDEILYKKSGGLHGLLGQKKLTNDIYYNEDGSIGLDSYYQMNTVDSIGSKALDATGRGFLHGVLGRKSGIGKLLGKTSAKGAGKGWFKGATSVVGGGTKALGKGLDAGNKAGLNLNKFLSSSAEKMPIYEQFAKQMAEAGVGDYKDIMKTMQKQGFNMVDSTKALLENYKGDTSIIYSAARDTRKKIIDVDNIAKSAAGATDDVAEAAVKGSTKVGGKSAAKVLLDKTIDTVKTSKPVAKVVDAVKTSKPVTTITKVVDDGKGLISKICSKITSFFDEIASNNKLLGFFKKAAKAGVSDNAIIKAIKNIGKQLGETAIAKAAKGALTKIAAAVGKYIPYLNIALYIADFLYGYNNADTILGVAKGDEYKVGFGQKCLCGLLNLITANLTLGLVPNETVVDIIIEFLFPLFGLDASELQAARDRADNILDEWNKAHPDETYSNLEDFNDKDKLWTKMKKGIGKVATKAWGGIKNVAGKAWEGAKNLGGKIKDGAVNLYNKVKDSKFGQAVSTGFTKVKEFGSNVWDGAKEIGGKVVDVVKNAVSSVWEHIKGVFSKALDVGKFIKDMVANTVKASINPDFKWDIDQYLDKDDPLCGLKKTIYGVMKLPLVGVAVITKAGKGIFNGIKKLVSGLIDGGKDAFKDLKAVFSGEYSVFSKEYWAFNDNEKEDEKNPLGVIGKISSTIMKVLGAPNAMLGWVGNKVFDVLKTIVKGAKEGGLDGFKDIKEVAKGKYTIFSTRYWKPNTDPDNPLSILGTIFGYVSRTFGAVPAMMGWTGTKIFDFLKNVVKGAKEGGLDGFKDIANVATGKYTVFSGDYWKPNTDPNNPLSILGTIFGYVGRFFGAVPAMMGWTGTKIFDFLKNVVVGAKEGGLDAFTDIANVVKGQYTVFSGDYWKSNTDPNNPLSITGTIFGYVGRFFGAVPAMLGWVGGKIFTFFNNMINGAKEGTIDAAKDIHSVVKGEYTIFNKKYWTSDEDDDGSNPLSTTGKIFGFVNRTVMTVPAMLGYVFSKIGTFFKNMIEGAKDVSEKNDDIYKKVENGKLSIFSKDYWKVTVDEDNPLGLVAKIGAFLDRLVHAPILLIKSIFGKLGDMLSGVLEFLGLGSLDEITGGKANGKGRHGRGRDRDGFYGSGHAYQSDRMIADMKYGDSTIKKAGCAPVAATNIINNINPNTMDVRQAANFAEKNGLTIRGGGTDMRYFNKFLGSQGIATVNTKNTDAIEKALKNGHQVIMLGQDGSNAPGMPFGTNPHFITATGIDKRGNIIVQDPDLPQSSVVYKKGKIFKSLSNSIITDGSAIKSKKGQLHGLGRRLFWGGSGEDGEVKEPSLNNLMSELGDLGSKTIKSVFGDAYSALYGEENEDGSSTSSSTASGPVVSANIDLTGNDNAEKIWNFLISKGYSKAGAAGVMGNLYAESGLNPKNVQNSFEAKYGNDDAYTRAVDSKSRGKETFANDSAGYGLAQWTYHSRKRGLYDSTVSQGKSIADLGGQLAYLDAELQRYGSLYDALKTTSSVNTASDRVLTEFERPAVLNTDARRSYSNKMYSQFAGSGRAANALNAGIHDDYYGGARVVDRGSTSHPVDYAVFLQTIVTLLTNISGNTAILSKILEILSKHFDIKINKAEIEAAANSMSKEQTMAALNDIVQRSGSNSKVSKLLNTQDTDYIFAVMSALAQE